MDIREISTPALAYLGDCVIELCVRQMLVERGLSTSAHLSAPAQAEAMKRLAEHLTEEEAAFFRRGRNMGHSSVPKRSTVSEYRAATGMEVLFGYLHVTGQAARIAELFCLAYPQPLE